MAHVETANKLNPFRCRIIFAIASISIVYLAFPALGNEADSSTAQNLAGSQRESAYVITDFGAKGDGKTLNTKFINKVMETCAAAGGGKVIIPPGRYLTGPIFLKSNIHIEIQAGAVLLADDNISSYPSINGRWEGIERKVYASLFTGLDLQNVAITGRGSIDGQGKVWWDAFWTTYDMRRKAGITEREPNNPPGAPLKWPRPRTINLYRCKNVLIRDITITNSPSWTIHPVYCEDVTVDNVTIYQPDDSPNTDGVNPDSCKNVRISNCHIDVGDDCITLKSGYNADGRRVGIPCENIAVTNCTMLHGHGGVVIGSEMSGDVRNVVISNCVFDGTTRGLRIKTDRTRGGIVEDIRADNIVMRNISESAFTVTAFYDSTDTRSYPVTETTPQLRNMYFSNISVISTAKTAEILGLREMPIENLQLRNIEVHSAKSGIDCRQTKGTIFENIVVNTQSGPALEVRNSQNLNIDNFTTRDPNSGSPVIVLENVDGAVIRDCQAPDGAGKLIELLGDGNKDIKAARAAYEKLSQE